MSDLDYQQMIERENEAADKARLDLGEKRKIDLLKDSAFSALRKAEERMYNYAKELEVGPERTKAFEVYENIRLAARVR